MLAFGISAAYAGAAGALFAIATTFVNPDTFPVALSIFLLVGVVVSGLGSLIGPDRRCDLHPVHAPVGAEHLEVTGRSGGRLRRDPDPRRARPAGRRIGPRVARRAADAAPVRLSEPLTLGGYHRRRAGTSPADRSLAGEPRPMSRKLTLACLALVASLALGATAALAGTARGTAEPGVTATHDPPRRHGAAERARIPVRVRLPRRRGLLQVRQRQGRRATAARSSTRSSTTPTTRRRASRSTRQLVEQDKVFAVFNSLGTVPESRGAALPEQHEGAAAVRRVGCDHLGTRLRAVPVHDRLPAELPGGGLGLRQVPGPHGTRCHDRRPVPERRLRQGPAGRAEARPAAVEGEGDRRPAVRRHVTRRLVADREAEVVRSRHAGDLRHADVRGPGVHLREQARLEAQARDQQRRRLRLDRDAESRGRRAEQARRQHDLDRVPEGPDRSRSGRPTRR